MKQRLFSELVAAVDLLSPTQRHRLLEQLQHPQEIPDIIEHLDQRLRSNLQCPHCSHTRIYRWGTVKSLQRYRCRGCLKTFTALTHTPLSRLHKRETWLTYAQSMLHSEVLRVAAYRCDIHLTTSFRWRHRFLQLADCLNARKLAGIVESDQTLFRESFKGQRTIPGRAPRKRGKDQPKDARWISVLVARDRKADEADFVLPNFTLSNVEKHLLPRLSNDIVLCTDGHLTFEAFTAKHNIEHRVLNASAGERVKASVFHIQGVNSYHQRLKGWIERFHGVATRYLSRYLGWFRWFEQHRSKTCQPADFMEDLISPGTIQHLART